MTTSDTTITTEVARYLEKPVRRFRQLDGWANRGYDGLMVPDDDGDVLCGGIVHDRQISGTTVRVLIDPDADSADVFRVLAKLADWHATDDRAGEVADDPWSTPTTPEEDKSMTTDTPAVEEPDMAVVRRMQDAWGAPVANNYLDRLLWAFEQDVVRPEDVPQVERTFESVAAFQEWMRATGIEDAWDATRRLASCPAWCELPFDAADHQPRIGPGETCMHVRTVGSYVANGERRELTVDALETFDDVEPQSVHVEGFEARTPDELVAVADALWTAAVRWREVQA